MCADTSIECGSNAYAGTHMKRTADTDTQTQACQRSCFPYGIASTLTVRQPRLHMVTRTHWHGRRHL
eukprot:2796790-Alexandrium_andersonii.AAC.1